MFHILKGKEPSKLARHRNDKVSKGTFDNFSLDKGKREVKNQLLKEQGNLCAYCTASINFDNMKIEHWLPQNNKDYPEYKEFELKYSNMLGVCQGCILCKGEKYFHCDHSLAKGEKIIQINPLEKRHVDQLSYNKSGLLKSSNSKHQTEIDTILNLNIPPLLKVRKDILNIVMVRLHNKYKNKTANYPKILKQFSSKKNSYSAIIVWYLKKKIKTSKT